MHWVADINFKSTFLVLPFFFCLLSCEEQVAVGDKLSDAERNYIRERAALKCVSETTSTFKNFYQDSGTNMTSYREGQAWKLEYKKDDTLIETSFIYVWKVSGPDVYFRLKMSENGVSTNRFFKINTTQNEEMALNLQYYKCTKTFTVSEGSGSITATIKTDRTVEDTETKVETDTEYRHVSTLPLYFGVLDRKVTKRSYNNDDTLTKTETFDYVITSISDVTQPASYADSSITNREFCVPTHSSPRGAPYNGYDTYAFPFARTCLAQAAISSESTDGPDGNGGGVDFTPSELN